MRLISELRRRNVLRMAALYSVAAWLIVQVAEVLIDLAKLPDWVGTTTLWLLGIGFPIALIFSWFYEITPQGISLEKDVDQDSSITHVTGRRLDFIVISLLCAAVILFAYDKWWIGPPPEASIAVLPFVNMSDDASNEYFSDGLTEELLNLLAKIPELQVTSRSSAFAFKGKDIDVSDVAQKLNVAHVLEGSVRKSGNQIRITAQLIEARSDTHLWSETWDRTLVDIFAIQDEIAAEVVSQLEVTILGARPMVAVTDPEAYALYLQAKHFAGLVTPESWDQAIEFYQQALEIDPDYAPTWIGLAGVYKNQGQNGELPFSEAYRLADGAANRALAIDPGYALAHATLGSLAMSYNGDLEAAAGHYQQALALNPRSASIIGRASGLAFYLDRIDDAIVLDEYVATRDPVNPVAHGNLGIKYFDGGRLDEAIDSLETALTISPGYIGAQYYIGLSLLRKDDASAALEAFRQEKDEEYRTKGTALALYKLGRQREFEAAFKELRERWGEQWEAEVAHVYAWTGDADGAFEWLDKAYESSGYSTVPEIAADSLFDNIHDDPRWLPFLQKLGKAPEQLAAINFEVTLPK